MEIIHPHEAHDEQVLGDLVTSAAYWREAMAEAGPRAGGPERAAGKPEHG